MGRSPVLQAEILLSHQKIQHWKDRWVETCAKVSHFQYSTPKINHFSKYWIENPSCMHHFCGGLLSQQGGSDPLDSGPIVYTLEVYT